MKNGFLLGLFLVFGFTALASANEWQITATRKKAEITEREKKGGGRTGKMAEKPEGFLYQVKVTNGTFQESPAVEARYMIFIERQKLGTKASEDVVETIRGKAPVPVLKGRGSSDFQTKPATLWSGSLGGVAGGGFTYFEGGGRVKTKDRLIGIWVKLFADGQEVGQYANPSNLTQKEWKE